MAIQQMKVDIFPKLGPPVIYVAQPYGGMDPAQMEGYLTYYYEYHFLYINGIEHVESKNIQGIALMKLTFHPGTDMAQAMARDDRLRQPRARLHAAGHRAAVHHAVRRRQRAGRLPRLLEHDAQSRRDPGPRAQPRPAACSRRCPGVSAPPPFGGSQRTIVVRVDPDRLRAYGMSPDEVVVRGQPRNDRHAVGQRPHRRPDPDRLDERHARRQHQGAARRADPARRRPDRLPARRRHGQRHAPTSRRLRAGERPRAVYIPVTKRADASTLDVVSARATGTAARFKRGARRHQGRPRVRPVALRRRARSEV